MTMGPITFADLCDDLVNLQKLAILPPDGEYGELASSTDRRSIYDAETDRYLCWDYNWDGDGGGQIPMENGLLVFADLKGPGCIRRIWSAAPKSGRVKIFIDGAYEPSVDLPFADYFDSEKGWAPFRYPGLVYQTPHSGDIPGGFNNFVPIAFQKSCRILAEPGWGAYYHFNYSRFPAGTKIEPFRPGLSPEHDAALQRVSDFFLKKLGENPAGRRPDARRAAGVLTAMPGEAATLARLQGTGAVTSLKMRLAPMPREAQMRVLRELVLRIFWDNEPEPAVWCPLGDFFGTAPGINPYRSLPLGMQDDGFYSYWYMPFADGAQIEVLNEGDASRVVSWQIEHVALESVEGLGRIHAKWHRDAFLPEHPDRAPIDWTILKTRGRGRYCGVALNIWNPLGGWWGEGDEKFFVDGEKFPSTFGTGSEDYFGYAWCLPLLFSRALHNQTLCTKNRFHVAVNRWHTADNVPFHTEFEGAIEKYYPNSRPALYSAVAYWYLDPAGTDPYRPVPVAERVDYYEQSKITRIPGAIEGEEMPILLMEGGEAGIQNMGAWPHFHWSSGMQLNWARGAVGDRLGLQFSVEQEGEYEIFVALTKANDFAIAQYAVDDVEIGPPIDAYNPVVIHSGETLLGRRRLLRGDHCLSARIVGQHQDARPTHIVGLDYLRLSLLKA